MKYAVLIYDVPSAWSGQSEEDAAAVTAEYMAINSDPSVVGGAHLQPAETATTVRVEGGETLTTDGPFADTKEIFGGYFLVEADDLDAVLELAKRIPAARVGGAVEVRPIVEH